LILLSTAWLGGFDASTAIGAWGIAWALAVVLFALWVRHYAPPDLFEVNPVEKGRQWIKEARPFLAYRALLTLMAYASIPILDGLQTSSAAVSAFAAAMATTGFAVALVTATNRLYGRQLSILLERRDFEQLQAVRRARMRWLIPAILLFLAVSLFFTRSLLSPFGVDFAEEGVMPLRILAIAAAVTMTFALAPTYLKYTRRNRLLFSLLTLAVAVQGALLLLLVPRYSATGAAIAYASGAIVLYGTYAIAAHRALLEMRRATVE
jgi:O-antigen/teichoic acid export membrane protein